jgi:hypothetical protein
MMLGEASRNDNPVLLPKALLEAAIISIRAGTYFGAVGMIDGHPRESAHLIW